MEDTLNNVQFYYINPDCSTERRAAAEKQAAGHGINLQRIAAVNESDLTPEILESFHKAQQQGGCRTELSKSEHACVQSHLKALRQFLTTNSPYAVILEDNFVLHPNFKDGIEWLTHKTHGWKALMLYPGEAKPYSLGKKSLDCSPWEQVFPKKLPWLAVGTIYTRKGAELILESFKQYWMCFDVQLTWNLLTQSISVAGIFPALVTPSAPASSNDAGARCQSNQLSTWRMAYHYSRMRRKAKKELGVIECAQNPRYKLTRIINKGARRLCLEHPEDSNLCIKVAMYYKHIWQLRRDLMAYKAVEPYIKDFLPLYGDKLVDTNLGPGLVCELVKDDDGSTSQMLTTVLAANKFNKDIFDQLMLFSELILKHSIPFYDMNPNNFLVQVKNGKQRLLYIDLKYYNDYKPWVYLHLEKVIPALSRAIVKRRFQRLRRVVDRYWKAPEA